MRRLLLFLLATATVSHAGMLYFRVPATAETMRKYSADLDRAAARYLGWPCMAPDNYAITYRALDGSIWACPGNGDRRLTRRIVEAIADDFSRTRMDITYVEQGKARGLEPVRLVDGKYLTDAEIQAAEAAREIRAP